MHAFEMESAHLSTTCNYHMVVLTYPSNFQGFLSMLKERFSRSTSRDSSHLHHHQSQRVGAGGGGHAGGREAAVDVLETSSSANVTPEMVRRTRLHAPDDSDAIASLQRRTSTPEVVRIRTTTLLTSSATNAVNDRNSNNNNNSTQNHQPNDQRERATPEVIRHGSSESHENSQKRLAKASGSASTSNSNGNAKKTISAQSSAEVVRHQTEAVTNSTPTTSATKKVPMAAQNRQVRPDAQWKVLYHYYYLLHNCVRDRQSSSHS